jgi:hypothetical protein
VLVEWRKKVSAISGGFLEFVHCHMMGTGGSCIPIEQSDTGRPDEIDRDISILA